MAEQNYWQRRVSRRRVLQGVALGSTGLAAVAVIGCEEEEKPAAQQGAPQGGQAAADQPLRGGTMTWANESTEALPIEDIHANTFGPLQDTGPGLAYSRILRYDLEKFPDALIPIGDLAESWENPDPTTYIFKMRRDVKWQNLPPLNGRQFKASDATFSVNRIIAEKFSASLFEQLDSMETPDDFTLRMKLKKPDADFLVNVGNSNAKIAAPEAVAVKGHLKEGPHVGTGPWIYVERVPEQIFKMRRNPDYFGQPLPYADEYVRLIIPDPNTAVAAFRTGQVLGLATNGQKTQLLKQTFPNLEVHHRRLFTNTGGNKMHVATTKAPTNDVRVRQALLKVLDRDAFIRDVAFGSAWLSAQIFIYRTDWLLPEDEIRRLLARDVPAAKQLIQAAGLDTSTWKPIIDFGVPNQETTSAAELAASHLKSELGIVSTNRAADKVELTERIYQRGEFELCVGNNTPTSPTNAHLLTFYHTKGPQASTWRGIGDSRLDSLIEQQAVELDNNRRGALLKDIQRRVIELAAAIPLYTSNGEYATSPRVGGYKHALDPHRWAAVWLRG